MAIVSQSSLNAAWSARGITLLGFIGALATLFRWDLDEGQKQALSYILLTLLPIGWAIYEKSHKTGVEHNTEKLTTLATENIVAASAAGISPSPLAEAIVNPVAAPPSVAQKINTTIGQTK